MREHQMPRSVHPHFGSRIDMAAHGATFNIHAFSFAISIAWGDHRQPVCMLGGPAPVSLAQIDPGKSLPWDLLVLKFRARCGIWLHRSTTNEHARHLCFHMVSQRKKQLPKHNFLNILVRFTVVLVVVLYVVPT
jgi:hypothetical protein